MTPRATIAALGTAALLGAAVPGAALDSLTTGRAAGPGAAEATGDSVAAATSADSVLALPDSVARAEAEPDTSVRVTGTPFRFGFTPAMIQRHGRFAPARAPAARTETVFSGPGRWFGVEGDLTFTFRSGRLRRVLFQGERVSARARDYARDQLRRSGFRRTCEQTGSIERCTWLGATRVQLEVTAASLKATLEPGPRLRTRPAPVAVIPETFVLGRAATESKLPPPVVAESPPPTYPEAAEAQRVQGNVWIRAAVDTAGRVVRARVTRSIPELDDAAIASAMRWRFEPYRLDGAPAMFEVEFPVRFVFR